MYQQKKLRIFWGLTSMSFLFIGLSGCKDFSDVHNLGKRAESIRATSESIGKDFYQSCVNRANLPNSGYFPAIIDTRTNEPEKKDTYTGKVTKEEGELKQCEEEFAPASDKIVKAYDVLVVYLEKLAILADEDTGKIPEKDRTELNNAVNDLGDALTNTEIKIPDSVTNNVDNGIGILGVVFDIIGDKIKEDAIVPAMICTDDEIKAYTKGLEQIASQVYVNALNTEADEVDLYFTRHAPRGNSDHPSASYSLIKLDELYVSRQENIEKRIDIAEDFAEILTETRKTHSKISQEFENGFNYGKDKDKKTFCSNYESQIETTDASFKIKPAQAQKISRILKNYQKNTAPLFEKLEQSKLD